MATKLEYLKRSKEVFAWMKQYGVSDPRQWTVASSLIDKDGEERKGSTFSLDGLRTLEVIK